jgi:pimeloyl-ACP methyl ester carboxylesterase
VPVDVRDPSLGTTSVGFALFRRDDRARPARGTIVAVEGGPGYGTIASRFWYLRLFRPLLARHDLLLMDLRGTGRSDAVRCPELQRWTKASHDVAWPVAEARCAARLGPMSERYGSAFAAQDLALLLDALAIDRVDLYGDSYGTFFAQTFAVRHPDRVRTLTLDAAYPIEGVDGWWRDTNAAARVALRRSCRRDATCTGDPLRAIRRVVRAVRREPLVATVPDADGHLRHVRFTPETMGTILANSGYAPTIDRELLAASRAFLRRRSDPAALLRIAAEQGWYAGAGNVREYSQGLATATSCNDYPMLWDRPDPFAERRRAFREAVGALRRDDPGAFDPLRISEWATAADASYRSCIRWPAPEDRLRPFPAGGTYPDVPTLVLDGEFDSVTSPWGARRVARSFPDATYVEVPNAYHVTGLDGPGTCVTGIILRLVRRAAVGDTSCVRRTSPPIRVVEAFPETADEVPGSLARRAAAIAAGTVGDVIARWDVMGGYEGVGLRGGTFRTWGYDAPRWRLDAVRWVRDVAVDGRIATDTFSGRSEATVTLAGPSFPRSRLTVRWNALRPRARASVVGTVGGAAIDVRVPVP